MKHLNIFEDFDSERHIQSPIYKTRRADWDEDDVEEFDSERHIQSPINKNKKSTGWKSRRNPAEHIISPILKRGYTDEDDEEDEEFDHTSSSKSGKPKGWKPKKFNKNSDETDAESRARVYQESIKGKY